MKRKACKSKLDLDWTSYKQLRNSVTREIELAKRDYFNNLLKTQAQDASKLWSSIRKLIPKKSKVAVQEISLDEKTFTGSLDIANCFNKFFTSVGSRLRSLLPTLNVSSYCDRLILTPRDTPDFVFKDIQVSFVRKELSSLCVNKSSGLKDIHSRILKVGSNVLAAALTHIFNLSIRCGEIPRSWKAATVTPLHKSGSHCDPNNFRPISVLPVVMKIFERAIHKQLYDHLVTNKLLSQFQSGFRPGHSTSTALLDVSDYILKNIDEGNLTGAVFLDLSKAFDIIDHSLLKTKLAALGVRGRALAWFDNYLSGRTQSVSVNGTYSDTADLSLGVPQGSVLGPLLFILFINDLPSVVHCCKIVLYADDTALFFADRKFHSIQSALQEDLNAVGEWFSLNRLLVNCDKTNVMLFGSKQRLARSQGLSLFLLGKLLELSNTVKYLGLTFDASMDWHEHINNISNKVTRRLNLLGRIRKFLDTDTSKLLYTSLVQPLMEYCDIVWSNADNTILQRLLRLQKRGARIILQKKIREDRTANLYCELGWVSLFERWNFHKCLSVFKCLNGIYPSYLRRLFSYNSDVHHYNTRNRANLHMVKITSKSGYRSFAYSAAKLFNNLDYATKRSLTLKEFVNNYWSK